MSLEQFVKVPPQNAEAEAAILGSCLLEKDVLHEIIKYINPEDFYRENHKEIFEAIIELYSRHDPVDVITVGERLSLRGTLDSVGGLEYLTKIVNDVPTTANYKYYAEIIKNMSVRRQIIKACHESIEAAYNGDFENSIDLKNMAMQKLDISVIKEDKSRKSSLADILANCVEDIENQYRVKIDDKLYFGFSDLDRVTAGLHPEELTIIAARPGVGKTAFAIQLMLNLAYKENSCLLVSREMSTLQIGKRILSNYSGVNGQKLRFCKSLNDEDWIKLTQTVCEIGKLPIEISDSLTSIQEIRSYCRELRNKGRLDVLFIDYLGLLKTLKRCDSRRAEIEDISRQCKELSMEFGIPVVVLCQLNRANERDCREPKLIDLRESGSIEQDADNVLFLHVPKDTDERQLSFDIKVIISKQRNGPVGYIYLKYYRSNFTFCSKC